MPHVVDLKTKICYNIDVGVGDENGQKFLINGQNFLYFWSKISIEMVKNFYTFGRKQWGGTN